MQQIFGVWVALFSPQHYELYEINAFYAEMFISLFHLTAVSHKGSKCRLATHAVTSFETFKYSFLYRKNYDVYILLKFVQLTLHK